MKNIVKLKFVFYYFILLLMSCNNEEIFEDSKVNGNNIAEALTSDENTSDEIDSSLPCDFLLENLKSGSNITINCVLDLKGATIKLPENITLIYEGGAILNGSIDFSQGSIIDADLLSPTLSLTGATPKIKDPLFVFSPKHWGIMEGKVSDELALKNKEILNSLLNQTQELGVKTFEIGKMDAYFKVDVNSTKKNVNAEGSIQVPANFHLKMSDDTYLRVQPNNEATYTLLSTYLTDNITISGGNLVGDRYEHDYSPTVDETGTARNSHGWGYLVWIIGSHNIEVNNVNLSKAIGDGIVFHSKYLRNPDGSLQAGNKEVNNVIIKNCTISDNRRQGISILDGKNITIDHCIIKNIGNGDQQYNAAGDRIVSSAGTEPMYGVDLEAIRVRKSDGSLDESAVIENINVKNSTFTGNEKGDIVLYTASNVIIENNDFDFKVGSKASHDVIIRNNNFVARDPSFYAISVPSYIVNGNEELNYNYQISNNKIQGYEIGLTIGAKGHTVSGNTLIDCVTGIQLRSDLYDTTFSKNAIQSALTVSYGYKNAYNSQNIDNVIIRDENISVGNRPISLIKLLDESKLSQSQITFKNCDFNTAKTYFTLYVGSAKNIHFEGNRSNIKFQIVDSEGITLANNTIN